MVASRSPCDAGVVHGTPRVETKRTRAAEPWVLAASILGSSMAFIDGSVVNLALPALEHSLGATVRDAQWVVESYALFLASLLLIGGALGDQMGRRRVFAWGVATFAIASAACGLAPDPGWLIAARAVQGIGAALLVPGSLALLSATFPPEHRGRAIGIWSAGSSAAAGIGPVLGGWLIETVSWRWIFWLNLPLAAATLAIAITRVPESRAPDAKGTVDWLGAALATAGLWLMVYGLIATPSGRFDVRSAAAVGLGVLVLCAFGVTERRSANPMVPLEVFQSRTFTGANLLTLFLYTALGGAFFFLPFLLIQVHHYGATAAGAAMLPFIVLMFLLSPWVGGLADRFGARLLLVVGPFIVAIGYVLLALTGKSGSYWTTFFPGLLLLGFGMSVSVAPLTSAVMASAPPERAGAASGINNAVSRTAGLLAVAAFGLIASWRFNQVLDRWLEQHRAPPAVWRALAPERDRLAGARISAAVPSPWRAPARAAVAGAFEETFRVLMLLAAGLAVAAAGSAGVMIEPRAAAGARNSAAAPRQGRDLREA
jgi:EmrB/QacA subfamily drug resistance transporter